MKHCFHCKNISNAQYLGCIASPVRVSTHSAQHWVKGRWVIYFQPFEKVIKYKMCLC